MSFKKRIVLSSMSAISVIMLFLGNTFKYDYVHYMDITMWGETWNHRYDDTSCESISSIIDELYSSDMLYTMLAISVLAGVISVILFMINEKLEVSFVCQAVSALVALVLLILIFTGTVDLISDVESLEIRVEGLGLLVYYIIVICTSCISYKKYKSNAIESKESSKTTEVSNIQIEEITE